MSPISNSYLYLNYKSHPLYDFFCKGLLVALSTDDPLQFHHSTNPLEEEYNMAAHVFNLTNTDTSKFFSSCIIN